MNDLYLWLAVVYVASVITSYFVGQFGLSNLETDLQNLHLQSPISVTPTTVTTPAVHVTTPITHVSTTTTTSATPAAS